MITATNTPFSIRHPDYSEKCDEWEKWRDTMETGNKYIERYMLKFSARESDPDFEARKKFAPIPAHAKSCLLEIRNSIFQRLVDVTRRGGSDDFQAAMAGQQCGVDLHGKSMNQFTGIDLLEELISMAKVGIYTDMPVIEGKTLADQVGKRPYYYMYKAENILSWSFRQDKPDEFSNLMLRDYTEVKDSTYGLPCGVVERIRHLWLEGGKVHIEWWTEVDAEPDAADNVEYGPDSKTKKKTYIRQDFEGNPIDSGIILDLESIPFAVAEISDSLLADVANFQIMLMNMNSSDIAYLLKSGHPFYTEQREEKNGSHFLKGPATPGDDGKGATAIESKPPEVLVGAAAGRFYGPEMERPGFIHPSAEPIKASMEKQADMKDDIRKIMNLSLSNVKAKMASQGSKEIDNQGLESGLSAIGLVLELLERKCAMFWRQYENRKEDDIVITYPSKYSLQSDEDRRKNAQAWIEIRNQVPSVLFMKWVNKQIVKEMLGDLLSPQELEKIYKEVDDSEITIAKPEDVLALVEAGVLDKVRAAAIFGIPKKSVDDAAEQHLERLLQIQATQTPIGTEPSNPAARGMNDQAPDKSGAKAEKKKSFDQTTAGTPERQGRGKGRNVPKPKE